MTQRNLVRLLIAQTVLMVLLGWSAVYLGRDEFRLAVERDDEEAMPAPSLLAEEEAGQLPEVRLNATAQRQAGVELQLPTATAMSTGGSASDLTVTVIDPQPLAEWRGRLQAALQELAAARAVASASQLELSRVQALFDDDRSASQRALESASAQMLADAARERSAQSRATTLRDGARAAWGPVVAGWLEAPDGAALQRVVTGREALLRTVLRADDTGPSPAQLDLIPPGRSEPIRAQGLGPVAPVTTEAEAGGRHLLFLAPGAGLGIGLRLNASRPGHGTEAAREGGLVPASAVIWHAGQSWIYVREALDGTDEADLNEGKQAAKPTPAASSAEAIRIDRFQRRGLPNALRLGEQWFVPGLETDDPVVVRGAQLLLSEELKSQIKNENDD